MVKSLLHISTIVPSLVIFLSLCSLPLLSSATENPSNPYIYVAPLVYVANETGELFNINIDIANVNNLRSVELELSYNASLLDVVQVVEGQFLPPPPQSTVTFEINRSAGFVWMNISAIDLEQGQSGNGTLVEITFNVTLGTSCSHSVLSIQNTLLCDYLMAPINHSSMDGLYFWKSLQPDPPVQGALLDVFTQKGGIGRDAPGGFFVPNEEVEISSYATYNNWPVQQILVAFQGIEPIGSTVFIYVYATDQNGYVKMSFRIPMTADSYGTWTVVSVANIACETVWDTVQFDVIYHPVGGFSESVNKFSSSRTHLEAYYAFVVVVLSLSFIIVKRGKTKEFNSSCEHTNTRVELCGEKRK